MLTTSLYLVGGCGHNTSQIGVRFPVFDDCVVIVVRRIVFVHVLILSFREGLNQIGLRFNSLYPNALLMRLRAFIYAPLGWAWLGAGTSPLTDVTGRNIKVTDLFRRVLQVRLIVRNARYGGCVYRKNRPHFQKYILAR